jgi:methylamine dehydrogenase heavy chain
MRVITTTLIFLVFAVPVARAQIEPQTMGPTETLPEPGENWFITIARGGGFIFDATTGEMYGTISKAPRSPAIQPNFDRREFYSAGIFYTRDTYGERTDLLIVHDFDNLSPIAEIEIPQKSTILGFRNYLGLLSGGRHVASSNMTPAQSVSITDVVDRRFVGEISTPGCSLILPVQNNDFLTICGDGTLMLIGLDDNGEETNRVRSAKFFDVQEDPVYDRPVQSADGWLLFSHGGKAFDVTTDGDQVRISSPWDLLTGEEREEGWWPGGAQLATLHRELGIFYITMHQGEPYSHHEPGTEVWVYNTATQRKIGSIPFETPVDHVMVTQESSPLLIVGDEEGGTHVYDALTFRFERTIDAPDADLFEDF